MCACLKLKAHPTSIQRENNSFMMCHAAMVWYCMVWRYLARLRLPPYLWTKVCHDSYTYIIFSSLEKLIVSRNRLHSIMEKAYRLRMIIRVRSRWRRGWWGLRMQHSRVMGWGWQIVAWWRRLLMHHSRIMAGGRHVVA